MLEGLDPPPLNLCIEAHITPPTTTQEITIAPTTTVVTAVRPTMPAILHPDNSILGLSLLLAIQRLIPSAGNCLQSSIYQISAEYVVHLMDSSEEEECKCQERPRKLRLTGQYPPVKARCCICKRYRCVARKFTKCSICRYRWNICRDHPDRFLCRNCKYWALEPYIDPLHWSQR